MSEFHLKEILNVAITLTKADYGNIQLVNAEGTGLEIVVQNGFNADFLKHFESVPVTRGSSVCGRAAENGKRTVIEDVEQDPGFKKHLKIAQSVPFCAVQSTPLIGRNGKLLGMLSTHFREPRLPDQKCFNMLDDYLAQSVPLLEQALHDETGAVMLDFDRENARQFLTSLPLFKELPQEDMNALLNTSSIRNYKKGALIIQHDNKASKLFIVMKGWIKTCPANQKGFEGDMMLLSAGDEFGADAIFDDSYYIYSATAETDARLLLMPADALRDLIRRKPAIAAVIMRILADDIKARQLSETRLRRTSVTARVACLLLNLTAWTKGKGVTFKFPYRKSVAASQLGMDNTTFSRALSKLEEWGVTSDDGGIGIQDFITLSRHCCVDCPLANGKCKGQHFLMNKDVGENS